MKTNFFKRAISAVVAAATLLSCTAFSVYADATGPLTDAELQADYASREVSIDIATDGANTPYESTSAAVKINAGEILRFTWDITEENTEAWNALYMNLDNATVDIISKRASSPTLKYEGHAEGTEVNNVSCFSEGAVGTYDVYMSIAADGSIVHGVKKSTETSYTWTSGNVKAGQVKGSYSLTVRRKNQQSTISNAVIYSAKMPEITQEVLNAEYDKKDVTEKVSGLNYSGDDNLMKNGDVLKFDWTLTEKGADGNYEFMVYLYDSGIESKAENVGSWQWTANQPSFQLRPLSSGKVRSWFSGELVANDEMAIDAGKTYNVYIASEGDKLVCGVKEAGATSWTYIETERADAVISGLKMHQVNCTASVSNAYVYSPKAKMPEITQEVLNAEYDKKDVTDRFENLSSGQYADGIIKNGDVLKFDWTLNSNTSEDSYQFMVYLYNNQVTGQDTVGSQAWTANQPTFQIRKWSQADRTNVRSMFSGSAVYTKDNAAITAGKTYNVYVASEDDKIVCGIRENGTTSWTYLETSRENAVINSLGMSAAQCESTVSNVYVYSPKAKMPEITQEVLNAEYDKKDVTEQVSGLNYSGDDNLMKNGDVLKFDWTLTEKGANDNYEFMVYLYDSGIESKAENVGSWQWTANQPSFQLRPLQTGKVRSWFSGELVANDEMAIDAGKTYNVYIASEGDKLVCGVKESGTTSWTYIETERADAVISGLKMTNLNCTASVSNAYVYSPKGSVPDEPEVPELKEGTLVFTDTLDNAAHWTASNMTVVNGALQTGKADLTSAELKGGANNYLRNFRLSTTFTFPETNENGWFGISVRTNDSGRERILVYKNGVRWNKNGETNLTTESGSWSIEEGKEYKLDVDCYGNKITVLLYDGETLKYRGYFEPEAASFGGVKYETYLRNVNIDKVEIYNTEDAAQIAGKNIVLRVQGTQDLNTTATATNATWESADSAIAKVQNNKVVGVKVGETVLTLKDASGNVLDKTPVIVNAKAGGVTLNKSNITLQVGDSIGITATTSSEPSYLTWTVDNENVALYGSAYKAKTITALTAGTSTITVADGSVSASLTVTVTERTAPTAADAVFSIGGTGSAISPYLFGVHSTDEVDTAAVVGALGDIKVKMLRAIVDTDDLEGDTPDYGTMDSSNTTLNVPQMYAVQVYGKTADEVMAEIDGIYAKVGSNMQFIELGNEIYDGQYTSENGGGVTAYVALVKEVYPKIKAKYSNVKVGVNILFRQLSYDWGTIGGYLGENTWNSTIKSNSDYYDAVIAHEYTTIGDVSGFSTSDMLDQLYVENQYMREKAYSYYKTEFPNKEIWISEYGTYLQDTIVTSNGDASEQARKQFAKTTGVALTNIEKLFDMAAAGMNQSSYHFSSDAQGFGLVQGDTKLSNYYVFKEAGKILDECGYYYDITKTSGSTKTVDRALTSGYDSGNYTFDTVGAWGFGDANGVKYVVLSNRTKDNTTVNVGENVKKVWSYGGGDANDVLANYLTFDGKWTDAPASIEQPATYNGDYAQTVTLNGYQIIVCEVEPETQATTDEMTVKLYQGTTEIPAPVAGTVNVEVTVNEENLEDGQQYTVIASVMNGNALEVADILTADNTDGKFKFSYTHAAGKTLKVFLWNSFQGLVPLDEAFDSSELTN